MAGVSIWSHFVCGSTCLHTKLILLPDSITRFLGYRHLAGSTLGTQSRGFSDDALSQRKRNYVLRAESFLYVYTIGRNCHAKSIESVATAKFSIFRDSLRVISLYLGWCNKLYLWYAYFSSLLVSWKLKTDFLYLRSNVIDSNRVLE